MKAIICVVVILAILMGTAFAEGAVLKLPEALGAIQDEAFCGDTCLYEIVLPQTLKRIEDRAFAHSSVRRINLPDSIDFIADDAFEGCHLEYAKAESAYCKKWCSDHGIKLYNASDDNETGMFTDF